MSDKSHEDQDKTVIQPIKQASPAEDATVLQQVDDNHDATIIQPLTNNDTNTSMGHEETVLHTGSFTPNDDDDTKFEAPSPDAQNVTGAIKAESAQPLQAMIEKGVENTTGQKPLVEDNSNASVKVDKSQLESTIALTEHDKTYLKTVLHTTSVEEAKASAKRSLMVSAVGLVLVAAGLVFAIVKNIQTPDKADIQISAFSEVEFKSHFVVSLENNYLDIPPKGNASYYLNQWKKHFPDSQDIPQAERLLSNAYIAAAESAREKNNWEEAEELMAKAIKIVTK